MKKAQIRYGRDYLTQRSRVGRFKKTKRVPDKPRIRKKLLIFLWLLFFVLVLSYVFLLSPLFRIAKINIEGTETIKKETLYTSIDNFSRKKFFIFFDKNNIFLLTSNQIREYLLDSFPRISSIAIKKNYIEKELFIKLQERKAIGIFCQKNCYYFDNEGIIFEEAPQTSGSLILLVKDVSDKEYTLKDKVLNKELLGNIIKIRNILPSRLNLKIADFEINSDKSFTLKANTVEGWYILFDFSRSIDKQIQALELVLENKIENRKELEYIDLRIENKVYYK